MKLSTHLLSSAFLAKLCNWLIILVVGFYSIIALIPLTFSLPSTPISISYRAIYLTFSLLIITAFVFRYKINMAFSIGNLFFIFFWIVYGIRLVNDLSIEQITLYDRHNALYFYLFAFGGCFIPALAVACYGNKINFDRLNRYLFFVFLASNVLIILYVISNFGLGLHLFSVRLGLQDETANSRVINPIVLSLNGTYLILVSLINILFLNKSFLRKISFFGVLIGMFNLVLGASRGPTLIAFLMCLFVFFYHFKNTKIGFKYLFKSILIVSIISLGIVYIIIPKIDFKQLQLFSRINETFEKDHKEERSTIFQIGWDDFKSSPIFGKHFLIIYKKEGGYVHNVYIEVFHATGIVGAFFFYGMLLLLFRKCYILFQTRNKYIFVLTLLGATLLIGVTSGALYTNPSFWILITLVLTISKEGIKRNSFSKYIYN